MLPAGSTLLIFLSMIDREKSGFSGVSSGMVSFGSRRRSSQDDMIGREAKEDMISITTSMGILFLFLFPLALYLFLGSCNPLAPL